MLLIINLRIISHLNTLIPLDALAALQIGTLIHSQTSLYNIPPHITLLHLEAPHNIPHARLSNTLHIFGYVPIIIPIRILPQRDEHTVEC